MGKSPFIALYLASLLGISAALGADGVNTQGPAVDGTGPTNPTPPTLPTPGTGTGIDGFDSAPKPGTDGTARENIHPDPEPDSQPRRDTHDPSSAKGSHIGS